MLMRSLSHILAYAPSLSYQHASIKEKILAKTILQANDFASVSLLTFVIFALYVLQY